MLRHILLLAFVCFRTYLFAQYPPYNRRRSRHRSSIGVEYVGQIGVSAGQETFIGAPRGGLFMDFGRDWKGSMRNAPVGLYSDEAGFSDLGFHAGIQTSMLVFFAGWFSIGADAGFTLKPISLDVSVSRTIVVDPDGETVGRDNTVNPKLGVFIGPVWIQGGPSFAMNGKGENYNNIIRIDDIPFNFEVTYVVEL